MCELCNYYLLVAGWWVYCEIHTHVCVLLRTSLFCSAASDHSSGPAHATEPCKRKLQALLGDDAARLRSEACYNRFQELHVSQLQAQIASLEREVQRIQQHLQKVQHAFGTTLGMCLEEEEVVAILGCHPKVSVCFVAAVVMFCQCPKLVTIYGVSCATQYFMRSSWGDA